MKKLEIQLASPTPGLWPVHFAARTLVRGLLGLILVVGLGLVQPLPARGQENTADDETSADVEGASEGGQRADERLSTPEALAAYGKAATLQNNGAFDLAIDAWKSFIDDHESDPRVVDAHYNMGVCYMEQKQLEKAQQQFEAAIQPGSEFDRREDAFLNLGWTIYTRALDQKPELFEQAASVFDKMLEAYPEGQHRDQALFLRGESYYVRGQRPQAAESYEELVRELPDSSLQPNAMYALGVCFEEMKKYEDAAVLYGQFVEQFPDSKLIPEVRMRTAETLLQRDELAKAESGFAAVAEIGDFPDADFARFRQAFAVAKQERYEDAAKLFRSLPEDFPESRYVHDANMAAARAYYRAEKLSEAEAQFKKLESVPGPYASEAAHWRSRIALKAEQPEQALEIIQKQLPIAESEKHPFFVNLLMDQADSIYEMPGERQLESIPLYQRIVDDYPEHLLAPQALYNASFAAMESKRYEQAVQLADRFLNIYQDHRLLADVKHVRAESQLQQGDAEGAEQSFRELATANPNSANTAVLQLRQAVALYAKQDYAKALEELRSNLGELKNADERAEAMYLIGMSHFALKQFDDSADALERCLKTSPKWKQADDAILNLSRAKRKQGKTAEAKQLVSRLIQRYPKSKVLDQAHFRKAEYCYALGNYDEAIKEYGQVVSNWPESNFAPYSLYGHGWSLLRKASYQAAESSFSKLLGEYPEHNLAHQTLYARSMVRQQAGRYADSLKDVDAYLQKNSSNPREISDAQYVRGLSLVGQKDYTTAIAVFEDILKKDSNYPSGDKVLYELGWAYKLSKQNERAQATFATLANRFPKSRQATEAFYHVGEAAYQAAAYDKAAAAYQKARDGISKGSELGEKVLYKLGWSEYQRGNLDESLDAFDEQVTGYPAGSLAGDAHFMKGECSFRKSNFQDAIQSYADASRLPLSSEQITTLTYLHAGQSAAQLGEWKVSYDWLTSLSKKYPNSPYQLQVGYELAVAHQNLGNTAEAEKLFTTVAERGQGELAARGRFMLGEVLYAKRDYITAIREFRKVMFGFDANADPNVGKWQAKAGFEAGQCAGVVASQEQNRQERANYIDLAQKFFQYVVARFPDSDEARASRQQLRKYGL